MAIVSGRLGRRTSIRCPHCLSRKSLSRDSADLPGYLRSLGDHLWCDACLRHYFRIRLLGLLFPMGEPKRWQTG